MKLILFAIVWILVINHGFLQAISTSDIKIQTINIVDNKTTFLHLNTDCLLTIFDNLDVSDLISLAKTNTALSSVTSAALKHRFAKKQVKISFEYGQCDLEISEDAENVHFIDTNKLKFVKILQDFGHLFSNLEICADVDNVDFSHFFEQVNSYCFETLTKLCISTYKNEHFFERIKKPFKSVKHLSIWHRFEYVNNLNLTFSEMFPAIIQLESSFVTARKEALINQKYPHLKFLKTIEINSNFGLNELSFKELIKNNPHIRGLSVDLYFVPDGLKFLKFVSENLPNLEHLELSECRERDDGNESINIHFEHLKTLIVRSTGHVLPLNMTFGQLEELETAVAYTENSDRWMELVKHQKTLKKLTVTQYIRDSDILQIANADSQLVELIYNCACDWQRYEQVPSPCGCNAKVESIVQMLEKSKYLQSVTLRSGWAANDSIFNALQSQLPEWTITRAIDEYRSDCVYFERTECF